MKARDTVSTAISVNLSMITLQESETMKRLAAYAAPPPTFATGVLGRYARLVGPASEGGRTGHERATHLVAPHRRGTEDLPPQFFQRRRAARQPTRRCRDRCR